MKVKDFRNSAEASLQVAYDIANRIRFTQFAKKPCVLGLATGSTPQKVYDELVKMHKRGDLSFNNVITFNLDEYYPMSLDSLQSYHKFMYEYLFDHIDIPKENINIPRGDLKENEIESFCKEYEDRIKFYGGIDIQLLGIGRTGHIGFNEPGSSIDSKTRLITLDHVTRLDAASDFFGEENVPKMAITMGIGTILEAKEIILMAWGENKSQIIKRAIEGDIDKRIPATFLQKHKDVSIYMDEASSSELKKFKTPWLVGKCIWNDRSIRKAVVWLCQKVNKPILKLADMDYNENGLTDLIDGDSNKINIKVFNDLQHTITGWPGGKPNADDATRPVKATPYPKKILVFSPHPDDDVISMGGTLDRLVNQGHDVHVAYMTTGNIAVFDDDVIRYVDFLKEFGNVEDTYDKIIEYIKNKKPGDIDNIDIQRIKTSIRKGESRSACRYIGIRDDNIHFLDLPFYDTGKVKKNPITDVDINIIKDLLNSIKPDQIYAAGDLSDPHGTHRVCMNAILEAIEDEIDIWLYRGAWQEWEIENVDMAVPLSPKEVIVKRRAIFKHQSQKDRPLFPGVDPREFWQRSEDRNRETAILYDKLGMAEYQAIEVFKKLESDMIDLKLQLMRELVDVNRKIAYEEDLLHNFSNFDFFHKEHHQNWLDKLIKERVRVHNNLDAVRNK